MVWLSKIFGMTYNLERREYIYRIVGEDLPAHSRIVYPNFKEKGIRQQERSPGDGSESGQQEKGKELGHAPAAEGFRLFDSINGNCLSIEWSSCHRAKSLAAVKSYTSNGGARKENSCLFMRRWTRYLQKQWSDDNQQCSAFAKSWNYAYALAHPVLQAIFHFNGTAATHSKSKRYTRFRKNCQYAESV